MKEKMLNTAVSGMASFLLMLFLYFVADLFTTINQQLGVPLQVAMLSREENMVML